MATSKIAAERNQKALLELVSQPGNDICADCKARAPRWASHNLGIFICVQCASVHRKLGTHISKVKSLTLDSWTKEQLQTMKENGNVKSNNFYNPDETRHPPPTNHLEAERDSETEKYIRAKYQYKKFVNKSAFVEMHLGPSRSASSQPPLASSSSSSAAPSPSAAPVVPPVRPATAAATISGPSTAPPPPIQNRSASLQVPVAGVNAQQPQYGILNQSNNPLRPSPLSGHMPMRSASQPLPQLQSAATATASSSLSAFLQPPSKDPVWNDLISLQTPSQNSSLPLQMTSQPMAIPNTTALGGLTPHNPFAMQLSHSPGQMLVPQGTGLPSAFGSSPGVIGGGLGGMPGITGSFGTGTGLVGLGVTAGGVGGSNPFQHHLQQPQVTLPSSSITSPFNPFTGMAMNHNSMSPPQQPFGQVAVQPQSQPFGGVAAPTQPQIQTPQPQFLPAQGHSPQPTTMFTQTPPPFGMGAVGAGATPPMAAFGSTPSPMPFQPQQQQLQQIAPMPTGNPFVSWTPQGQQQQQQQQPLGAMGYGMSPGQMPQQHWGGM